MCCPCSDAAAAVAAAAAAAALQRAPCLNSYEVTEEDVKVFEAHGLQGPLTAFTQLSAATPAHLAKLRYLESGLDLTGDGVMYSTGLSLRSVTTGV
jgi:hypothetical protein